MPEPYYDDGAVRIYNADCLTVLPTLEPVDMVITDPPYNVGKDYGGHDDSMDPADYEAWCAEWFRRVPSDLRPHDRLPRARQPSGVGCWHKPGNPAGGGVIQFCEWEPYLLWGKGMGGSDVVRATVNQQQDTGAHPCPKPLKLFSALIGQAKATSVVDPFMGSGTTLRAAKNLGVNAMGIELNESYCRHATGRMAQEVLDVAA